jgi:predicted nucleotide-binding protein
LTKVFFWLALQNMALKRLKDEKKYSVVVNSDGLFDLIDYLYVLFFQRVTNPMQISLFLATCHYPIISNIELRTIEDFRSEYNNGDSFHIKFRIIPTQEFIDLDYKNEILTISLELSLLYDSYNDILHTIIRYLKIDENRIILKDNIKNKDNTEIIKDNEDMNTNVERKMRIFVSHGRDTDWRLLKDELQDTHGYIIDYFEKGQSFSKYTFEVLEEKLNLNDIAIIVFSAEDKHQDDDRLHARENVIHEAGLFQGKRGRRNVILLVERDLKEFSNILGITQIRYDKGNIIASVSKIIAALKDINNR